MLHPTIEFSSHAIRRETMALDALERFYAALNAMFTGDAEPMESAWLTGEAILMGPFGGRQLGRSVQDLLRRDASMKRGGQVLPRDLILRTDDQLGYAVCTQRGQIVTSTGDSVPVELRATHILRRVGDDWSLICLHTDPLPEMQQASDYSTEDMESPEEQPGSELARAVDEFYAAMSSMFAGDLDPLDRIWSHAEDVTSATVLGNLKVGFEAVRAEFENISHHGVRGTMRCSKPVARVDGDLAYISCRSEAPNLNIAGQAFPLSCRTSLVFRWLDGRWRVAHYHSDYLEGAEELCK